jgi:hypothetical protein
MPAIDESRSHLAADSVVPAACRPSRSSASRCTRAFASASSCSTLRWCVPGIVCRADQRVLAQELLALLGSHDGIQRPAWCRHQRGAEAVCRGRREAQVGGQERRAAHRLEFEQPGDRERSLHEPLRQIGSDRAPVAGQHHRRQVPARRMPGDDDAARVAAELGRVAPHPRERVHDLHRDLLDAHRRAQGVVGHDHRRTRVDERRRDERMITLVERAPVATVHEHEHRRAATRGRKDVERLAGAVAIGHVEAALRPLARQRRGRRPALEDLRVIGDARAVVVLGVQPFGGGSAHEASGAILRSRLSNPWPAG